LWTALAVKARFYAAYLSNYFQNIMAKKRNATSFERWTIDAVRRGLNVTENFKHPALERLLQAKPTLSPQDTDEIRIHQENLLRHITRWNEQELQVFFIAHILAMVNFEDEAAEYRPFMQRSLTATIDDITLTGRVDFMVATGYGEPYQPYFFLHEYKKERGVDNDPLAQLLASMAAAQHLNDSPKLIYGCYVLGRNWFFVVLDEKQYAVSVAFDATSEDLAQIVTILREVAEIIRATVQAKRAEETKKILAKPNQAK
jgi:hypothetical protein